jgi:chromosome segregation protein
VRLKRVRIYGFKTFADKTEIDLDGSIISVVGPNGCGKSNIVDAILWALGETNARSLRAQSNQDVIFSGSSRRKPLGYSEVSLLFDNEDGSLPIDSPEVLVTRRLSRSGDSSYSINRRNCRLKDVVDLLADSGLGRTGYAIVGQSEIDQALAASAQQRRAWIDEAAGVQRYRIRRQEAQRRLASANSHLEQVKTLIRELESQIGPLEAEAATARRHRALSQELRSLEVGLLSREAMEAAKDLDLLAERSRETMKSASMEAARAQELEGERKLALTDLDRLDERIEKLRADLSQASWKTWTVWRASLPRRKEQAGTGLLRLKRTFLKRRPLRGWRERPWRSLRSSWRGVEMRHGPFPRPWMRLTVLSRRPELSPRRFKKGRLPKLIGKRG